MRSNYKPIGDFIQKVDERNRDLKVTRLLGLSMTKEFRETTSNIVGTDMSVYRVMNKYQFACDFMSPIRVNKLPVVLKLDDEPNIVSPAYPVFEITDRDKLDPEYLMMWFRRPEFDRYVTFKCDATIRGGYEWTELCETLIPVPSITKQREIVKEYNVIQNHINLNQQLIQKLEETAQAIYKEWFVDNMDENWKTKIISEIGEVTTGKTPPTEDEENFGNFLPFITIPDMHNNAFALKTERSLSEKGVALQKNKTLPENSICVSCIGTAGLVTMVTEPSQTNQQINSIICHKDFSIYYLFMTMKSLSDIIQSHGEKGSVGNNLNKQEFSNLTITFPPDELLKKFQYKVSPIFEMIKLKTKENHKLSELKELLLSKLATVNQY